MKQQNPFLFLVLLILVCSGMVVPDHRMHKLELGEDQYRYSFQTESDNYIQRLFIGTPNKKKLVFKVEYWESGKKTPVLIEGKAQHVKQIGDGESILDEDFNLFFVQEYIFHRDGCTLLLRIDDELQAAQLFLRNCEPFDDPFGLDYNHVMKPE